LQKKLIAAGADRQMLLIYVPVGKCVFATRHASKQHGRSIDFLVQRRVGTGKSGFSNGDIVKIQGLTQSKNGRTMNELLEEVVHVEKDSGRIVVFASPETYAAIRHLAIKAENMQTDERSFTEV
jgi:hypothetical protein